MKVAVCISGQPRSFDKGYWYLEKNLLDHHDCDIFIHTWENPVVDVQDIIDLYKPRSIFFEDYPVSREVLNVRYHNTPNPNQFPAANSALAFYSMFKTAEMKRRAELIDGVYDAVIKTRFDYALNRELPLSSMDRNKIHIPNCRMVPDRDFGNDQFAFGSSWVMDRYMSTFMFLDYYYNIGIPMNGEAMMCATLRHHGLFGEYLEYMDMNNPFPPGPWNGTPHSLIRDDMLLWKNV